MFRKVLRLRISAELREIKVNLILINNCIISNTSLTSQPKTLPTRTTLILINRACLTIRTTGNAVTSKNNTLKSRTTT